MIEKSSSSNQSTPSPLDERIDDLLDQWEEARSQGRNIDSKDLCPDDPKLAAELQRAIDEISQFEAFDRTVSPATPESIGSYRVLQLLSETTGSRVFLCEQSFPRREVAVKVLDTAVTSARRIHRFNLEAQILASLSHPGIVQVYDVGIHVDEHGRHPFFAMEYVRGQQLDDYLQRERQREPFTTERLLELFVAIAEALQAAHQQSIVHRDLKPSNIMVTNNGMPKVIDFGIARLRLSESDGDSPTQSVTKMMLGTAPYMSPEQYQEDSSLLDARSDIYSLAVVLYESISGRLPYDVAELPIVEMGHAIRHRPPAALPKHDSRYDRSLNAVLQKALSKEPRDRYQTITEFADDLQRVIDHEPVQAKPVGPLRQLLMWGRRNPLVAALGVLLILVLFGSAVVTSGLAVMNFERAQTITQQNFDLEKTVDSLQQEQAKSTLLSRSIQQTNQKLSNANLRLQRTAMNATLMRASQLVATDPIQARSLIFDESLCPTSMRGLAWDLLEGQTQTELLELQANGSETPMYQVAFAMNDQILMTLSRDHVRWWNTADGQQLGSVQDRIGENSRAAMDASGARSVVSRIDGQVFMIDRHLLQKVSLYAADRGSAASVAISQDGREMAIGTEQGDVFIWDNIDAEVDFPMPRYTFHVTDAPVLHLEFHETDEQIAVVAQNGVVGTYQRDGSDFVIQQFPFENLTWASLSDDWRYVSLSRRASFEIWDRETEEIVRSNSSARLISMLGTPKDDLVLREWTYVYHTDSDGTRRLLHERAGRNHSFSISADQRRIAVGTNDGRVAIKPLRLQGSHDTIQTFSDTTQTFSFSPDSRQVAVAGRNQSGQEGLRVYRVAGRELLWESFSFQNRIQSLKFSPDGATLFVKQSGIQLFDVETGTPLNLIERSGPAFKSLAVAESGDRLFIGTRETGRILIYSLKEQRIVSELPESLRYCNHLLLHSNNEELLAFYHDGVISNWKLADEELAWRVDTGVRFLNKASLSTNGRMLAIGYTKGSPQIYSISGSGIQHITTLRTPTSLKTSLDFSPDGSTLVTGNVAGKIVLWDTSSWEAQLEMGHPHTKVTHVRFSPDGQVLAASGDKGLSLWKIDRDAGQ